MLREDQKLEASIMTPGDRVGLLRPCLPLDSLQAFRIRNAELILRGVILHLRQRIRGPRQEVGDVGSADSDLVTSIQHQRAS
jgi:hypothetical protein